MKSVRYLLVLSLFFMLTVLSGCASQEEIAKGNKIVASAEPIIKQYVKENYNDWEVKKTDCLFEMGDLFQSNATAYVRAVVEDRSKEHTGDNTDKEFDIIYDTENNIIYSNYNSDKLADEIEKQLNLGSEYEVDISFICKNTENESIDTMNYYNTKSDSVEDYKLYIGIKKNSIGIENEIYSRLECLSGIDYVVRVLAGDSVVGANFLNNRNLDINSITNTNIHELLTITKEGKKITEQIRKTEKTLIDGGYILYEPLKYNLDISKDDTKLGVSESPEESSSDSTLNIKSLDSSNENIQLNVVSKEYNSIVYGYVDTFETNRLRMKGKSLLGFNQTYVCSIDLNNINKENKVVLALFNEKTDE